MRDPTCLEQAHNASLLGRVRARLLSGGSKEEYVEVGEVVTNNIKPGVEDELDSGVVSVNGTVRTGISLFCAQYQSLSYFSEIVTWDQELFHSIASLLQDFKAKWTSCQKLETK